MFLYAHKNKTESIDFQIVNICYSISRLFRENRFTVYS
jgi:hypothetical protein